MTLDTFALNIGTFFRSNSNSFTVTGVANTEDQYSSLVYSTNTDTSRHQQHRYSPQPLPLHYSHNLH